MKSFLKTLGRFAMSLSKPYKNKVSRSPRQSKNNPFLGGILKGMNVISQKPQTGTGKTLAFLLPILQRVHTDVHQEQVLIHCTYTLNL